MEIARNKRSCYNCRRYPLCRAYKKVSKVQDEGYWFAVSNVLIAIANQCEYYSFDEERN